MKNLVNFFGFTPLPGVGGILYEQQTHNGTEFKNNIINLFWLERKFSIFLELFIINNKRVLSKRLTGQFKFFFYTCNGPSKDDYSLNDSICDFLLYYNYILHYVTKVSPFKPMMNDSDKELMEKKKEKHPKKETKSKDSIWDISWWQLYQSLRLH